VNCEDVCSSIPSEEVCLSLLEENVKDYLAVQGVEVDPKIKCGSIIIEIHGTPENVDSGITELSTGCIPLESFDDLCGVREITDSSSFPTVTPTTKTPTFRPTSFPSPKITTTQKGDGDDVSTDLRLGADEVAGDDSDVMFEFAGFTMTETYMLYASGIALLLVCCFCCFMVWYCCRCRQKAKEKRKNKEFNSFFAEFQATPGMSADSAPLPPAPMPSNGMYARRRSSRGLSQLVSTSFADVNDALVVDDQGGAAWNENMHSFDDTDEIINFYAGGGAAAAAREPVLTGNNLSVSMNEFEIWGSTAEQNANIFTGLRDEALSTDSSDVEGGEASYLPDSAPLHSQGRRTSILDGQVVPAAPTQPVPFRRSLQRLSSRESFRESTLFVDGNHTAPGSPRRPTRRSHTASRAETIRTDSHESPREYITTSPQGEESIEELEEMLLNQNRPSQPPTFYEKSNLIVEDEIEEEDIESSVSTVHKYGGAVFVDPDEDEQEDKIIEEEHETPAGNRATWYENAALLLDDNGNYVPGEYQLGQTVEYSVDRAVWELGEVVSLEPLKVKGRLNWQAKEYPYVRLHTPTGDEPQYMETDEDEIIDDNIDFENQGGAIFVDPVEVQLDENAETNLDRRNPEWSNADVTSEKRAPGVSEKEDDKQVIPLLPKDLPIFTEQLYSPKREARGSMRREMLQKRTATFSSKRDGATGRDRMTLAEQAVESMKRDANAPRKQESNAFPQGRGKRAPVPLSFGKRNPAERFQGSVISEEDSMDLRDNFSDIMSLRSFASSAQDDIRE